MLFRVTVHPRTRSALRLLVVAVLLPFGLALASCTQQAPTERHSELPSGITVDVYQSRIDYSEHKLEVAVTNSSTKQFTVLALSFSSPVFRPAVDYERAPTTVRPGTTTDLRLLLPPADCSAAPGTPTVRLRFAFGEAGGDIETGAVALAPHDRMGQLPVIAAEDCRDGAVAAVATIAPASAIRYTTLAGEKTAILDFTVTPTGDGGLLTIDDVRGTVLLGALDPTTGRIGDTVPLDLSVVSTTTPIMFSVTLVPARCDPHVVLEDKRGTFLTFTVTTKLDTGRIFIGVSDDVRIQLYDYVSSRCGWS